jgi:hypothetical protein
MGESREQDIAHFGHGAADDVIEQLSDGEFFVVQTGHVYGPSVINKTWAAREPSRR